MLTGIHHAAYRCHNARETVEFYKRALDMDFLLAISEDRVPSTGEPDPYMHVFLDAGRGNVLAFFELPTHPPMGRDENTPDWVQHIAFQVPDLETLHVARERLIDLGLSVVGPTDHGIFHSIYFFDPSGHRIELACDVGTPEQLTRLRDVAHKMLAEWDTSKTVVRDTAWLHDGSGGE